MKENLFSFGFFCSLADNSLTTNHYFQLKNLNYQNLKNAVLHNIQDLLKLLEFSKNQGYEIFRLGSKFIPFASHKDFKKEWLIDIEKIINDYKNEIKKHNIRITMHPSQFVILNSDNKKVIENSLAELRYHFWLLDLLELDENSVCIIHLGKKLPDKQKSITKFIKIFNSNLWLRKRLAIENDEYNYSAMDAVQLSEELGIPFVFDTFHHKINPSDITAQRILKTWGEKIPKIHLSSGDKNNKHADYVKLEDLHWTIDFFKYSKNKIHIMVEAKQKERAIEMLRKNFA